MKCKADHSTKNRIESVIHSQILNNDLTVVSCVYGLVLQPGAFISQLIDDN